ncbi:TraR/DksA family transcriptional regulator [Sphingobium aquiterrae]|uniref:TraR/DksA family transcriptional regulator n=1 Tax=Sphingobium aquiterrae TaxID=2038656 RepID=UPI0030159A51
MRPFDDVRQQLLGRLAALNAQVARIEEDQGEPLDDDFAEQAIAREDDEPLDAVERAALTEARQIRAALARLDAGTYGICSSCGQAIDAARIRAMPSATQCIGCAGG